MIKLSVVVLVAAYVAIVVGVVAHRFAMLGFKPALGLFALGLLASVLVALALALGFIASMAGYDLLKLGRTGVHWPLLSVLFVALVPGLSMRLLVGDGLSAPAIHDISTDPDHPLAFINAQTLRRPGENSLDLPSTTTRDKQRAHYSMHPLQSEQPANELYQTALKLAKDYHWQVHYENAEKRHFEAVATTPMFGFKDDIAVQIEAQPGAGSLVQMRSVSRVGVSDLGANAARIRSFLDDLAQRTQHVNP